MPFINRTVSQVMDTQGLHKAAADGDLVAMAKQIEILLRRVQTNAISANSTVVSPPN